MAEKEKKVIPFKRAVAIFIVWALIMADAGYLLYHFVLKPYIVDRPYIIKVEKPQSTTTTQKPK